MQKPSSKMILWISLLGNLLAILIAIGVIHWMGGIQHFSNKLKNRGLSEQYAMRVDQLEELPIQEDVDLVFLGNSLIANGLWSEWFSEYKVSNQGISGDGIEGIMKRLPKIAEAKPKHLFILIGVNDLAFHESNWLLERYDLLFKELVVSFPDTEVWIQSLLPVNNEIKNTGHKNKDISLVNSSIARSLKGLDINFLDLTPVFGDSTGRLKGEWTKDGLHLTGEAYSNWATFLNKNIVQTTKTEGLSPSI